MRDSSQTYSATSTVDGIRLRITPQIPKPVHVDNWIASKPTVSKSGTVRLYKSMILAALNWRALAKNRGGDGLIGHKPLKGQAALPTGGAEAGKPC